MGNGRCGISKGLCVLGFWDWSWGLSSSDLIGWWTWSWNRTSNWSLIGG